MEIDKLESHLKYINNNGVTLNIDERINIKLSLEKLQIDFNFEELYFWGKFNGKWFH